MASEVESSADEMEKPCTKAASFNMAFERLPDEIIEQILLLTNANAFASLIILNRKWREVSQQAHLYAHHLSRCASYSAAHHSIPIPEDQNSLPRLRRLFAKEIRRNLFEAYLRPQETVLTFVSNSISSSSAPGGEAFHFSISPQGYYVLAYSSSRINVLDVTGPEIVVRRELKILRRPASTTITDDGCLLAVLSTDLQVDLYDMTGEHPKHIRAVALDHTPRTIALSPKGAVLAAAYDSGVEVSSLDPTNISTDRRAVKCYAVDSLSFSQDGSQLLGTTINSRSPSTVVLTAPYYDPGGSLPEESISALWTTSILFPNGSRDCSHAVLLPRSTDEEANWTFTYDRVFETFRAVRIDDLRNGTTYFTGPIADPSGGKLLPSTLPTANPSGELVASGFHGAIWLYGIPEDLDALPAFRDGSNSNTDSEVGTPPNHIGRRNSAPSVHSVHRVRDSMSRIPQWQLLCDRFRNTFIEGKKIGSLDRVSAMTWVNSTSASFLRERLVAVAPGVGGQPPSAEDESMAPVDGGRISILDFGYSTRNGEKRSITIEVGMNEPEVLEEEHRDLDSEVALVRRRTVAQRRGNRSHVARSATTVARIPRPEMPPVPTIQDQLDPFVPRSSIVRRVSQQTTSTEHSETFIDEQDAFDAPYSQTSPRSGATLRRAATAAAVNRRLNPRTAAGDRIEFRRADGREEHPHESDADNWVPPPPPYTKDAVPPLPDHIQRSLLAEAAAATLQRANTHRAPSIDFPGLESNTLYRSRTVASTSTTESRRERYPFNRARSNSPTLTSDRVSLEDNPRPVTSSVSPEFDDLYDVSPPATPQPSPPQPSPPQVHQIPRRPVASPPRNLPAASPPPVMLATLQQPASPIPQHTQGTEDMDHRMEAWETTPEIRLESPIQPESEDATPSPEQPRPESQQERTTSRLSLYKEVPERPDNSHRITDLPPPAPIIQDQREAIESRVPTLLSRRSETAPVARSLPVGVDEEPLPIWRSGTAPASTGTMTPSLSMPSADQLARLNSRKGRPPSATDPRRYSGNAHQQPRPPSQSQPHNLNASWGSQTSQPSTPPRHVPQEQGFNFTPPRAASGAYGSSPQRSPSQLYPPLAHQNSPSRHNSRGMNGSPNLRPPMNRLETIHSQTSSVGEHTLHVVQRGFMSRQPSRAERSAAKNIKDAKKRGWRAGLRRDAKKDKIGDGASSAGWTDVSRDSSGARQYAGDTNSKEKKCVVM